MRACGSLLSTAEAAHVQDMPMTPLLLLLACSSPSVTVQSGAHPEAAKPGTLTDVLDSQIRRPIQTCYQKVLKDESSLEGAVAYEVLGSHGILKTNVTVSGPEALQACALEPMSNQRLLRILGNGSQTVGFTLTVNFSAG